MALLDGSSRSIELAQYRISAPGLRGTAELREGGAEGKRGGMAQATEALAQALHEADITNLATIELDVASEMLLEAVPSVRTAQGEPGLVVEAPDLGDTVGQVVLAIDEAGVITWNFPEDAAGERETPARRGAGGKKRFVIRATSPPPPSVDADQPAKRGLTMMVGRKLLKVLVYPAVDKIGGAIGEHYANQWEKARRPYLMRSFGPDNHQDAEAAPLSDNQWRHLASGRSLLFLHGTFSSTHAAFAAMPADTLAELHQRYGGRTFAFDHFSLSHDPAQNVREFALRVPAGVELDVDIVCHSRGGLVARALASEDGVDGAAVPGLAVGKIVFVGTPNFGTALADPDHMIAFIDRYTSVLNLVPPGPASAVADAFESVLTVVKMVGHSVLGGLSGLAAMDPGAGFLKQLGETPAAADLYAITADFEPGGGLRELVKQTLANEVVDRVFESNANDLVVPTNGVFDAVSNTGAAATSGDQPPPGSDIFPIPADHVWCFGPDRSVAHTGYFGESETSAKLLEWLRPG